VEKGGRGSQLFAHCLLSVTQVVLVVGGWVVSCCLFVFVLFVLFVCLLPSLFTSCVYSSGAIACNHVSALSHIFTTSCPCAIAGTFYTLLPVGTAQLFACHTHTHTLSLS
jgi:H+/gluconate symporter-like permease